MLPLQQTRGAREMWREKIQFHRARAGQNRDEEIFIARLKLPPRRGTRVLRPRFRYDFEQGMTDPFGLAAGTLQPFRRPRERRCYAFDKRHDAQAAIAALLPRARRKIVQHRHVVLLKKLRKAHVERAPVAQHCGVGLVGLEKAHKLAPQARNARQQRQRRSEADHAVAAGIAQNVRARFPQMRAAQRVNLPIGMTPEYFTRQPRTVNIAGEIARAEQQVSSLEFRVWSWGVALAHGRYNSKLQTRNSKLLKVRRFILPPQPAFADALDEIQQLFERRAVGNRGANSFNRL
jgi:hypothetical protein